MRWLILCALLTQCSPVLADSVYLGAWSTHFGGEYNETHNLVAYEHNDYTAGYFKNSHDRDTVFISKDVYTQTRVGEVGAMLGAMRGYTVCYGDDDTNSDVCPMIAPYWEPLNWPVRVLIFGKALAAGFRLQF